MLEVKSLKRLTTNCVALLCLMTATPVSAQVVRAPLTDGFIRTSSIQMSVDEMLGSRKPRAQQDPILGPGYPDLWIAEIQYKPVRLISIPVKDPQTGVTQKERVWYLMYRIIPRDYTELAGDGQAELVKKLSNPEQDPENTADEPRAKSLLMPRFLLTIDDAPKNGAKSEHIDELNHGIREAIFRREVARRGQNLKLHNSVEAIQEVQPPVPANDPDALSHAVYGVAVWRNVDPATDFFTITMSGLTNAYRISTDANGQQVVEEKVVIQKFTRPGDEFLPTELEFQVNQDPVWEYRPKNAQLTVPNLETVLRNARNEPADPDSENK